jgi:hypothetical protein
MRRVPLLVIVLSSPATAHADRALTPGDVRDAGVIEVGAGLDRTARDLAWSDMAGAHDTSATELSAGLDLRAWFGPSLSLGVRQRAALDRSAVTDGSDEPLTTERGLHDLELDLRASTGVGPARLGAIISTSLPTGSEGIRSERASLGGGLFGAWHAHPALQPFALIHYEAHSVAGSDDEIGNTVRATAGVHGRRGAISLVPRLSLAHTAALPALGTEAHLTVEAEALVAYEPRTDLVLQLGLGWARAEHHALGGDLEAGADDRSIAVGIIYAWDLTPLRRHRSSPPPAAIGLPVADTGGAEVDAIDRALGARIPALRLATVRAEMDGGGARGDIRVVLSLDELGTVHDARVDDGTGNSRLAEAVRRFFLGSQLPATGGELEVLLTFR